MSAHIVVRFRGQNQEIGEMLRQLRGGRRRAALEALRDMAEEALEGAVCAVHRDRLMLVLAGTNPARVRGRLIGCCETAVSDGLTRLEGAFPDAQLRGETRFSDSGLTLH